MEFRISNCEYDISDGLKFVQKYLEQFDTSKLKSIFVSSRTTFSSGFVDGMCTYPDKEHKYFKIRARIIGPFPFSIVQRMKSIKQNSDGTFTIPDNYRPGPISSFIQKDGTWIAYQSCTTLIWVTNPNEALVWILGHELFHFLRKSKQIPGRNVEAQADQAGTDLLMTYLTTKK